MQSHSPHTPVVLVASTSEAVADSLAEQLRHQGRVAYAAHSTDGCLRMATSVGPDLVLMDASISQRVKSLLKAHPTTARTAVMSLSEDRTHFASAFARLPSLAYRFALT